MLETTIQTNTNNVNKTCTLRETTGGKDQRTCYYAEIVMDILIQNSEPKDTSEDQKKRDENTDPPKNPG